MVQPPTDYLHKFLAISGIIIILSCSYLIYNQSNEVDKYTIELQKQEGLINYQESKVECKSGVVDIYNEKIGEIHSDAYLEDFEKELDELSNMNEELIKSIADYNANLKIQKNRIFWLDRFKWISSVGFSLGIIISFFGFKKWHYFEIKNRKNKKGKK